MMVYKGFRSVTDPDIREAVTTAMAVLPGRLRGLRETMGLSVQDVAEEIGVSRQAISAYECGVDVPPLLRLVALAAFYGVTLDWLIWDEAK